jgi:hypothetical protein
LLKSRVPEIEAIDAALPDWQKELIDFRLKDIKENPDRLCLMDKLIDELLDI